jgi:CDP-glucose 4,6-dehydratase
VAVRTGPLEDLVSTTPSGFWSQRNVLVTGSTGLLGGWLTEALLARGANVIGLVRDGVPRSRLFAEKIASKVTTVQGGVEDLALIERTLNEYEVETVFHLAAQTIVGTANRSPVSTFETNIQGTWSVLEAARRVSTVKRILVASSDKAYGEQQQLPYDESTPLAGKHPYDVSKSCADLIAATYAKTYKSPVCVTRCGNFYGGGDLNWSRLVPGTMRSALRGDRPLIRSDGTMIRDYFYIEDAAEAYLLLAEKMDDPAVRGHAFNFSNELQIDVRDMVGRVLRAADREDLQPVVLNEASNEIPHQYLSAEKARRMLGWRPRFDMDEALRRTADWYRRFLAEA